MNTVDVCNLLQNRRFSFTDYNYSLFLVSVWFLNCAGDRLVLLLIGTQIQDNIESFLSVALVTLFYLKRALTVHQGRGG